MKGNMKEKLGVIRIDYDVNPLRYIRTLACLESDVPELVWATGDVQVDFDAAVKELEERGYEVAKSSSCDDFIFDGGKLKVF